MFSDKSIRSLGMSVNTTVADVRGTIKLENILPQLEDGLVGRNKYFL